MDTLLKVLLWVCRLIAALLFAVSIANMDAELRDLLHDFLEA